MATIWITGDTSGLIINDGNEYSALSGAVVDGSELISGALVATQVTGATLKNFTVTGGTLQVRDPINKADTITLNGGKLNLQRGGSAVNLDINGGALTTEVAAWGGGYVSTVRISAGTIMLVDGADAYDITQTGGTTYVISGATVTGFNYNGGTLNISSGATINGLTKNGGALSIKLYDGMTLNDYTLNSGWTEVFAGGNISGATVNSPSGAGMIIYTGGIVKDVELKQGQIQVQSGSIVDGLTYTAGTLSVSNGASINRFVKNAATGIDFKSGTTLTNVTLNAGWTTVATGAKISGGTLNSPSGVVAYAEGVVESVELKQGQLQIQANATVSGATVTGGELAISAGATANEITLNGGTLSFANGVTIDNLTKNGGTNPVLKDGTTFTNYTQNAGWTEVSSGGRIKGGSFNGGCGVIVYAGGVVEDVTRAGTYELRMQGGVWSGGAITGGKVLATNNNGGALLRDITVSAGELDIFSSVNTAEDIRLKGGKTYLLDGAKMTNTEVYDGAQLLLRSASLDGITVYSGGQVTSFTTPGTVVMNDLSVKAGGSMLIAAGFVLTGETEIEDGSYIYVGNTDTRDADVTAVDGTIYNLNLGIGGTIGDGVTLSNFTQTGGALNVSSGAAIFDIAHTGGWVVVSNGAELNGGSINNAGGGGAIISDGGTAEGVELKNGQIQAQAGATISGATVTGGSMTIAVSAIVNEINLNGGTLVLANGVTIDNLTKNGGYNPVLKDGTTFTNYTLNTGWTEVSSGGRIKGGSFNGGAGVIVYAGGVVEDVARAGTYELRMQGGVWSGGAITGGKVLANYENANAVVRDITVSAGELDLFYAGNSAVNLVLKGGKAFVFDSATLINAAVYDGAELALRATTVDGVTVYSGGKVTSTVYGTPGTITYKDATVQAGGSMLLTANFVLTGDINFEEGSYIYLGNTETRDENVTAVNGTIYDLNLGIGGTIGDGVTLSNFTQTGGALNVSSGAAIFDIAHTGGWVVVSNGAELNGGSINNAGGGGAIISDGGTAEGVELKNGQIQAQAGATVSGATVAGGTLAISTGATANEITLNGGTLAIAASAIVNEVNFNGGAIGFSSGASINNLTFNSGTLNVTGGATVKNLSKVGSGRVLVYGSDAVISGATVYGGNMSVGNGGALNDATISGGTVVVRHVAGWSATAEIKSAIASDVRVEDGAGLTLESGGILQAGVLSSGANLTIYKGGQAGLTSAAAGAVIDISFWDVNGGHGNTDAIITDWGTFSEDVKINVYSLETDYSYKIADAVNANVTLDCGNYRIFDESVKSGEQHSNAFLGRNLDFSDGMTLIVSAFAVGTQTTAAELDSTNATVLADGGLATKWDSATDVTTLPAAVAGTNTTGDAWLTVDGANLATALYGAEGNFAHDVNMWLYEGTIRNLAAGATAGGSVENVNLLVSDNGENGMNFTGVAYAGGFGNVTGEVKAELYGGTFAKDFYAGALANKLTTATSVGDITTTVTGGTFSGNIYGASAVKTDTTKGNGSRHTAGDVTLTVTGGSTTKGTQACIFAGGYATGDATGTVYTVDSVTATISGGSWGTAAGGRGIFGGIMASGVTAQAGDVNLTISGGSMGNVYGGGWAQKTNGKSIVGDVKINIAGGTMANVFGGGSHSTSGGSTEAGDITITVSGGNITGTIYARGQLDGDTTGTANVIFTGTTDFSCDVFGYTYVGGEASDATLAFSTYAGEFSGSIGGFNSIAFSGNTALTLTTAQDKSVSNKAWEFDFTKRDAEFSDTAFLSGAILTESNTVEVSFADEAQAKGGWSIAGVTVDTGASATFDLTVGKDTIVTELAYGTAISGGAYDGWGFELESGVLKFKNLA